MVSRLAPGMPPASSSAWAGRKSRSESTSTTSVRACTRASAASMPPRPVPTSCTIIEWVTMR